MTHSIKSLLASCTELLATGSDSARLDTEILLMRVLHKDRAFLFAHPEHGGTERKGLSLIAWSRILVVIWGIVLTRDGALTTPEGS